MDDPTLNRLIPRALFARALTGSDSSAMPPSENSLPPSEATHSAVDAAMEDMLAQLFPDYQIECRLGGGGGGTVYRAEHRRLRRRAAIKVLSGALTRSISAVARFEREIQAVGKLDDPGIVRAFDGGQREGVWFLAMELVEGVDFAALSRTLGPLPLADACELVRQAAVALQHAHERKLIHRDVKPSNLMVTVGPDGKPLVKVLDFGLAQLRCNESAGGELTLSGELLGTVDYVAPEQIVNPRLVDERADVYGLGATLYRLLSGQAPHHDSESTSSLYAKLIRISNEPCPSIATWRPDLSEPIVALVDQMVARDPAKRFASCAEVATALAPYAHEHHLPDLLARFPQTPEATTRVLTAPSRRRQQRRRIFSFALIWTGIVFALAFGLAVTLKSSKGNPAAHPPVSLACPRGITLGHDGAFYGGTVFGGTSNLGTLYRYTPGGAVEVLVNFTGTNGPFRGRMAGRQLLLARDGRFYGVTERGGIHDAGTLFRFDPNSESDRLTTLWDFGGPDGSEPMAGLIEDRQRDGVFYGGTQFGGLGGSGTLFQLDGTQGSPQLKTLVHLTGDTGPAPGRRLVSAMAQTRDGTLFGTTPEGGPANGGTVFRLTVDGQFTSLVSFGQPPWPFYNPTGGITLGLDGNLYGHCALERDGHGAIFRMTPAGELQIVARFGPPNGTQPASTLLCAPDGTFYGTTLLGGTHQRGTLFKVTPGGELTTLLSFPDLGGPTSGGPWGLPTLGTDGNLYSTIEVGGPGQNGVLYRATPKGELRSMVEFSRSEKNKR
jgi:uncharacterized repeat protein (TIGR03803 family)